MKLQYIVYKHDKPSFVYMLPIIKIYAFGEATAQEILNGIIQERYPELFVGDMYCQVLYFYPNMQPSLWDNTKFY